MSKKKNILFIVSRLPINTETGDRVRVYNFIRHLKQAGHRIDIIGFVPHTNYQMRTDIESLCGQCIAIPKSGIEFKKQNRFEQLKIFAKSFWKSYPFRVWQWYDTPFLNRALDLVEKNDYDAVHISEVSMGYVFDKIVDRPERPVIVYDLIDSVSLSIKNILSQTSVFMWPFRFIEYHRLKKFENYISKRADKAILISRRDKDFLNQSDIEVIPNGVAINSAEEQGRDIDLLFTGNMAAETNVDAALWFAKQIMPLLQGEGFSLNFYIVGVNPPPSIQALHSETIQVTGFVEDINEYYRRAKMFVCPMRLGAGQKNKILEAMINHTPVISTSEGNIGVYAPEGSIAIADTPEQFQRAIFRLLEDAQERERLAHSGYAYVKNQFSWQKSYALLEKCYEG